MKSRNTKPTTDFELCLNLSFRKASRVISQIYDRELADCGIKCTQFSILRATFLLKRTTNAELQDRLILKQTTLTRGLKPLIRDGLIQAEPGLDRRQKILSLIPQGTDLYQRAEKSWRRAQEYMRKRLGVDLAEQMIQMNIVTHCGHRRCQVAHKFRANMFSTHMYPCRIQGSRGRRF